MDADDTLWENNVYFERAFENFCEFLAHSTLTPDEVRAVLDEIEIVNNKTHGYGTAKLYAQSDPVLSQAGGTRGELPRTCRAS